MKNTKNVVLVAEQNGFQVGVVPVESIRLTRKDELIRQARKKLYGDGLSGEEFQLEKLTPLSVMDNGDGTYRLIDGYRRLRGLQSNGIDMAPVRVHPLQDNPDAYVIRGYLTQDSGEKWVTNMQKHESKKFFGDANAFAIDSLFAKYGICEDEKVGAKLPGFWGYHKAAEKIVIAGGQEALDWVLSVLTSAGWVKRAYGLEAKVALALYGIYAGYEAERDAVKKCLISYLKGSSPDEIKADAKAYSVTKSCSSGTIKFSLEKILNAAGAIEITVRKDPEIGLTEIAKLSEVSLQDACETTGLSIPAVTARLKAVGFKKTGKKFIKK